MGRLIVTEKIATGFSAYGGKPGTHSKRWVARSARGGRTMVRIDVGYWTLVVGILRLTDVPAPSRVHSYVHRWGVFTGK
jgi:hypothetical protein